VGALVCAAQQHTQLRFFPSSSCPKAEPSEAVMPQPPPADGLELLPPRKERLVCKHCPINCLDLVLNSLLLLAAAFSKLLAGGVFGVRFVWVSCFFWFVGFGFS